MRVFDYLAYLVALILYLPRLVLFWIYRALLFISKPGSLYMLPALLAGLFYWQYDAIRVSWLFDWWLNDVVMPFVPHDRIPDDYWYLGVFWALFTFTLYILTGGKFQILGTVLSALPQMRRPFAPALRLRLVEKKIRPAKVALAVPALKRRRKGRHAPDVTAGLSEPLRRLLEPAVPALAVVPPTMPEVAPEEPETPAPLPPELPQEEESAPVPPEPAKEVAEARPSRKPPPPPLPPKADDQNKRWIGM